jgi:hypothetical protein
MKRRYLGEGNLSHVSLSCIQITGEVLSNCIYRIESVLIMDFGSIAKSSENFLVLFWEYVI